MDKRQRLILSELNLVRSEDEIEENCTSVMGEYYIPSIGKTAFYKENGCMIDDRNDEDLREMLASDILKMIGMPCADILMAYDEVNNKYGCLSVNILNDNEQFAEFPTNYSKSVTNINEYIESDLERSSTFNNITPEFLEDRRKFLIRYLFSSAIISNTDIKIDNCRIIYNSENNEYRNPEYYDAGMAFTDPNNERFFGVQTSEEILKELYDNYPSEVFELAQSTEQNLTPENIQILMNKNIYNGFSEEVKEGIKQRLIEITSFVKSQNRKSIYKNNGNNFEETGEKKKNYRITLDDIKGKVEGVNIELKDKIKNIFETIRSRIIGDEISK